MFFVAFYQSLYLMVELLFQCNVPLYSGLLSTSYCIPSLVWNVWMFLFRWYFCQGIASCIFYRVGKIQVFACTLPGLVVFLHIDPMLLMKETFWLWCIFRLFLWGFASQFLPWCLNGRWQWHDQNQRRSRFYFLPSKSNSSNALGIQCDLAVQTLQASKEAQKRWWSQTWKCITFLRCSMRKNVWKNKIAVFTESDKELSIFNLVWRHIM